jgi:glycosyltransferase involved in cell wall biosynthesis
VIGFNVIGHVSGNLGLGVLARNVTRLLMQRGHAVAVLDVDPGMGRKGHDLRFASLTVPTPEDLPHDVNLFVLPAPTLQTLLPSLADLILPVERLNVALPMWELPVLPRGWDTLFSFFDVLLAGTPFIRSAFESSVPDVFVVPMALPIYLPAGFVRNGSGQRTTSGPVVFVTAFEPYSDPTRKNPAGVIEAFRLAVPDAPNARLLVKINGQAEDKLSVRSLAQLEALAAGCPSIDLVLDSRPYEDALSLIADADVVISLHRAEGLGLVPMEAMAMGMPVIATAWSGNMAYMSHRSACLVPYGLTRVAQYKGLYRRILAGRHALWAEPDIRAAARWIVRLAGDAGLRERYGAAAKARIAAHQQRAEAAEFIEEICEIDAHRRVANRSFEDREVRLAKIRQLPQPWRARLGRTLRGIRNRLQR